MTNWIGFAIAAFILIIVPIWVIPFVKIGFGTKVMFTILGLIATFFIVQAKTR